MAGRKRPWAWLALPVALLFVVVPLGCTKKAAIRNERMVHREPQPPIPAPGSAASNQSGTRERTASRPELREQTLRERASGEIAGQTAQNGAVDAATTLQKELQIPDIHFDFDEYRLKPENQAILKAGARGLLKHTGYTLVIEGHCDERGTGEYNLALGQKRADEAAKFLVAMGIARERIKTISYGEEMPLDKQHTEETWAKNRRDHFVTSPTAN